MLPWTPYVQSTPVPETWRLWFSLTTLDLALASLQERLFAEPASAAPPEAPDWLRAYT